jgi:hypothetical protein
LSVAFTSNTPSVCSVSGNIVSGASVGSCTVTASQAGDALYRPAPQVTQTFSVIANSGSYALVVSRQGQGSGGVTSSPSGIDCGSTCAANFVSGSVALTATPASGSFFAGWSGACTGTGACNVAMNAMRTVTASFSLYTSIPRLVNLSTRSQVLTGDNVLIGGFIIDGGPKTVVVRARGPSMAGQVPNVMANPTLTLYSGQTAIASNDDWQNAANAAAISASGFAPPHSLEPAILMTLDPGAYTAIVGGSGGTTGIGIFEVFEVDHAEVALINISSRARAGIGNDVMIGGFIIQGDGPQTVVVRARGPSLSSQGGPDTLANPSLALYLGQTVIASNDNWQSAGNANVLQMSGFAPPNTLESAILITLNPGAYTAIVSGADGGTGIGIVELFRQ